MFKIKNNTFLVGTGIIFILGFVYFLFFQNKYFLPYCLSPFAFLLIYLAISYTEKLVLCAIFLTPLSVTLRELGLSEGHQSFDLSLPTEPIFAGLLLLGILYQINNSFISKKILKHPLTLIILIQFLWIIITTFTSEMPLVSFKFFLARLWFVCTAFFFASYLFEKRKNVNLFFLLYLSALCLVIIITTIKHASLGFSSEASDWIMTPFYSDHTAYGAAIAMFIPICIGFILQNSKNILFRNIFVAATILLFIGLFLSSARAAWLSVAACVGVLITLLLKIKFRSIVAILGLLVGIFFIFQTQIVIAMENNTADSEGNDADNISSMTNIKTDPSNVERLNRWNCAFRMYEERPVFGFGPGTYILQYAPFQKANERTIISNDDGSNGNAHSEYLGPLAEQGLTGMLIVIALLLGVFFTGYRLFYTVKEKNTKILVGSILLGLATYFIHGFLNNFLDTDKLAIPFWACIAALVCIDIYHKNTTTIANPEEK